MRQAGRTLPEYRAVRKEAGSFWNLCRTPSWAAEVTLQPIRRFDLDAAIIFSDILMVPLAMGQKGDIVEKVGPVFDPTFVTSGAFDGVPIEKMLDFCAPVFEALQLTRAALAPEKALYGFAGGPWTVATYMVEGQKSKTHHGVKTFAYQQPETFDRLIEALVQHTIAYLSGMVQAGADVIQLFESWAGVLPQGPFERWVAGPLKRIAAGVKALHPTVPIIVFPRLAVPFYGDFIECPYFDGVNLDHTFPLAQLAPYLGKTVFQGGLDPAYLMAGGPALKAAIAEIKSFFQGQPYIFNMSHGLDPQTPVAHIAEAVQYIREAS